MYLIIHIIISINYIIIICYFNLFTDYVQCPYCQRRFNETAAQRHIPFCKEQHERLPNRTKVSPQALQRAHARQVHINTHTHIYTYTHTLSLSLSHRHKRKIIL